MQVQQIQQFRVGNLLFGFSCKSLGFDKKERIALFALFVKSDQSESLFLLFYYRAMRVIVTLFKRATPVIVALLKELQV